ncbi:hypothetical protein [Parapedobacter pyrenivorans]|uniref:hypothetical protein n=1 Tax=Parapedobacter pyrenivorans TaxID=1305674 RepID=UPI00333E7495
MGLLCYYLDGLAHFFAAHSRHGTHSPFVYRLLDEVIYPNRLSDEPRDKVERLVKRLIDRFQPGEVYTLDSEPSPTSTIDFALVDCGTCKEAVTRVEAVWPQFHAGSVLVLSGCHRTTAAKALWQSIKMKPEVTVTIDLFCAGLVFFRSGQAKENFRIRY